ncbi:alpha-ribazole phosphatase/probable phosphoglycerate mutase [Mariprofundus ferrinatatus]|uniref:Alpha-ribazole phosphatase/probable phosphoglycerate mutase n=1 Tax=Mariprofundus ferrinatatus TaxID=1921087 RepID=A0A2K8L8H3_9PROT|nr:histidine phosphatase family protein [Mariprofundus ferrinatatus]ATX81234.1 alpha-ribazole phosphatase/probable phosphoglycerate mutase [Mariprofundus ferrinatatus]
MLTMDILRHGALEGGIKYRGQIDDPLTADGRTSMNRVWLQLRDKIDVVVTSPLARCAGPATAWAGEAGIDCIIEPRVAEIHYGEWEGKTIPEIQRRYPGILEKWRENPEGMRPPGGESIEEMLVRLDQWWHEIRESHEGRHLLLVTHSGFMRLLIARTLGGPIATSRQISMPYTCWSRISHESGRTELLFHNRQVT